MRGLAACISEEFIVSLTVSFPAPLFTASIRSHSSFEVGTLSIELGGLRPRFLEEVINALRRCEVCLK